MRAGSPSRAPGCSRRREVRDMEAAPVNTAAIRACAVAKAYGEVTVLHPTDFAVAAGEVRGLVGSNGAGKSTLMKILSGAVAPSRGHVEVGGAKVPDEGTSGLLRLGVACIYQHGHLVPGLSVLDNLYLGRPAANRFGVLDRRRQRRQAQELLELHGIDLDLDAKAEDLPTVQQKQLEILEALALDARVLLMDEPTAWLSVADVQRLHETMRGLRARGVAIVYTSHLLDEVFAVCDTVSVMRDGRMVAQERTSDIQRVDLVRWMVGQTLAEQVLQVSERPVPQVGSHTPLLRAAGLGRRGAFQDVSFELQAGEILCVTGLVGAGRSELVRAIVGVDRFDAGTLALDGRGVAFQSPRQAMAQGIGFVPEDRHREGLLLDLTVAENLVLPTLRRHCRGLLLLVGSVRAMAEQWIATLNLQPPQPEMPVRQLSGGNQQKVLIGKWLALAPRVLILDEPTVGVDVGAKAEIYACLRRERDRGMAVLVVSSDLEEVLAIADRIVVMAQGRVVRTGPARDASMASLMRDLGAAPA
jgi:ABC-type sugar transport system ATPase subunit